MSYSDNEAICDGCGLTAWTSDLPAPPNWILIERNPWDIGDYDPWHFHSWECLRKELNRTQRGRPQRMRKTRHALRSEQLA